MAGYATALIVLVAVLRQLQLAPRDVWNHLAHTSIWAASLATGMFVVHGVINAVGFAFLARARSIDLDGRFLLACWAGSVLAKYVPGGVWQVAARGLWLSRHGVGARESVLVGAAEQGISLACCIALGAGLLGLSGALPPRVGLSAVGVLVACIVITAMTVKRTRIRLEPRKFVVAVLCYAVALLPYCLGYLVLASPGDPIGFSGALLMATTGGMLALWVPGGLGVREAMLVAQEAFEPSRILASLLAARLVILLSEAILSAAALGWLLRREGTEAKA